MAETPEYRYPKVDAIVTLGLQLEDDGSPKPELLERIDTAVRLFSELSTQAMAPYLIMSGSHSFNATPIPPRSEASAMADVAISRGVPAGAVIEEPRSLCTIGNALRVKEILDKEPGWKDLAVVTSPTHLPRTMLIFAHVLGPKYAVEGLSAGEPGPPSRDHADYEATALRTARTVFEGTRAGDDEAIWARLCTLSPQYQSPVAEHALARLPRKLNLEWLGHDILPQAA